MAYIASGLKMINAGGTVGTAPGNVACVYHYATNDAAATIEGAGYFNAEAARLKVGDLIHTSIDVDGTPAFKTYIVSANTGSVVTITPGASLTFNAKYVLTVDIADLSADTSHFVVAPYAGTINKLWSVIDGAVATADVIVTGKIATVAITNGAITIATAGSAAGNVASATPSAANVVTAGQAIELAVTGGGAGGSPRGHISIEITPS